MFKYTQNPVKTNAKTRAKTRKIAQLEIMITLEDQAYQLCWTKQKIYFPLCLN